MSNQPPDAPELSPGIPDPDVSAAETPTRPFFMFVPVQVTESEIRTVIWTATRHDAEKQYCGVITMSPERWVKFCSMVADMTPGADLDIRPIQQYVSNRSRVVPGAMTMVEYSARAWTTALPSAQNIVYLALKLNGEAGEVAENIGKAMRDDTPSQSYVQDVIAKPLITPERREKIIKELGDVLWYINGIALQLGTTIDSVARLNLEKLESRKERGVLHGEGDNR